MTRLARHRSSGCNNSVRPLLPLKRNGRNWSSVGNSWTSASAPSRSAPRALAGAAWQGRLTDVAHPRHDNVRARYKFRCGYCGVSEVDAGGQLTVDHHIPVSAGGDDSDANLVYCCSRCNLFKADFFPDAEQRAAGIRILHPLRDQFDEHVALNEESGELEPLTETGRFHIVWMHLNRPELVAHRLRELLVLAWQERLRLLEGEVAHLREQLIRRVQEEDELNNLLGE